MQEADTHHINIRRTLTGTRNIANLQQEAEARNQN